MKLSNSASVVLFLTLTLPSALAAQAGEKLVIPGYVSSSQDPVHTCATQVTVEFGAERVVDGIHQFLVRVSKFQQVKCQFSPDNSQRVFAVTLNESSSGWKEYRGTTRDRSAQIVINDRRKDRLSKATDFRVTESVRFENELIETHAILTQSDMQ